MCFKKKKNLPECLGKCESSYRCFYLTQENICHNIWCLVEPGLCEFGWLPSRMGWVMAGETRASSFWCRGWRPPCSFSPHYCPTSSITPSAPSQKPVRGFLGAIGYTFFQTVLLPLENLNCERDVLKPDEPLELPPLQRDPVHTALGVHAPRKGCVCNMSGAPEP